MAAPTAKTRYMPRLPAAGLGAAASMESLTTASTACRSYRPSFELSSSLSDSTCRALGPSTSPINFVACRPGAINRDGVALDRHAGVGHLVKGKRVYS
jgi:hypothetical protein